MQLLFSQVPVTLRKVCAHGPMPRQEMTLTGHKTMEELQVVALDQGLITQWGQVQVI